MDWCEFRAVGSTEAAEAMASVLFSSANINEKH